MKSLIPFNINENVRVRLTEVGLDILRAKNEEMKKIAPSMDWKLPTPDDEGYVRYQMWSLMETFGPHISMGMRSPFDTEIIFEVELPEFVR